MSNQNQLYLGMDLTPAQWINECRRIIKASRQAGLNPVELERKQQRIFNEQKQRFIESRHA